MRVGDLKISYTPYSLLDWLASGGQASALELLTIAENLEAAVRLYSIFLLHSFLFALALIICLLTPITASVGSCALSAVFSIASLATLHYFIEELVKELKASGVACGFQLGSGAMLITFSIILYLGGALSAWRISK
ncbi:MAG: hypothetical protein QXY49_00335 [Thermofilaceae archaeon]